MGLDILGWVECFDPTSVRWVGVVKLAPVIAERNSDVFAWLFGVRWNSDNPLHQDLPPVAAKRGLPADVSHEATRDYANTVALYPTEYFGASWVTLGEVQAIDWEQPIEERITASRHGQYPFGTHYWRSEFVQRHADLLPGPPDTLQPGMEWRVGDLDYRVEAMRRRDALDPGWQVLFRVMDTLASRWNDASLVRLVVWFGR
ncbi:MAG: hypothetical protein KGL95_05580 [Patescibacteria group bacterium]|nr:hypothetical protein [Patescibacteria group bacterium]